MKDSPEKPHVYVAATSSYRAYDDGDDEDYY